ncbi:hypothetical protein H6A37_12295 [Phocaeicola plebeius]|nr:hypothetical protein [Phocaeicola plebeius]MBM6964587.1 hypothetical protein [Phocaeicola plebeius]
MKGRKWIDAEQEHRHLRLDFFGEERKKGDAELMSAEQILSVSIGGYPLAYCIHEGNKYEGHTMLPVVTDFSSD